MTTMNGRSLPSAPVEAVRERQRRTLGAPLEAIRTPERLVFALPLAGAIVSAAVGGGALFINAADAAAVPALGLLGLSLLAALVHLWIRARSLDRAALLLMGLCGGAIVLLLLLPEWMFGGYVNGVVHHSVVSAPIVLLLSVAVAVHALRSLLGASPSGQDVALYPLLALPVVLALVAYAAILGQVVALGAGGLSLDLLTTAWQETARASGGWTYELGFLNNILGTFLLMVMTLLIAFLPGVGAGVFMSQYPGRLAKLIDFSTTMLRAVSMFIIGARRVRPRQPDDWLGSSQPTVAADPRVVPGRRRADPPRARFVPDRVPVSRTPGRADHRQADRRRSALGAA